MLLQENWKTNTNWNDFRRLTKKYLKLNLKKDHEQQPTVFSNKLTVKYKKNKYEDFKTLKVNNNKLWG